MTVSRSLRPSSKSMRVVRASPEVSVRPVSSSSLKRTVHTSAARKVRSEDQDRAQDVQVRRPDREALVTRCGVALQLLRRVCSPHPGSAGLGATGDRRMKTDTDRRVEALVDPIAFDHDATYHAQVAQFRQWLNMLENGSARGRRGSRGRSAGHQPARLRHSFRGRRLPADQPTKGDGAPHDALDTTSQAWRVE